MAGILRPTEYRPPCLTFCVQISHNRSLDGVLDELHNKRLTEAGSLDMLEGSDSDEDGRYRGANLALPGEKKLQLIPKAHACCSLHRPVPRILLRRMLSPLLTAVLSLQGWRKGGGGGGVVGAWRVIGLDLREWRVHLGRSVLLPPKHGHAQKK